MRAALGQCAERPIPSIEGIGLRFPHLGTFEEMRPTLGLVEFHSENLFGLPPMVRRRLTRLRADYSFSLHGVGLSLGSADGLSLTHLQLLSDVIHEYEPILLSEHLCWNRIADRCLPDLLPLPRTVEALDAIARNVEQAQHLLKREIAVENISVYARFEQDQMSEAEFLNRLVERTGCKLLLDLNNLYINQLNLDESAQEVIYGVRSDAVAQYHLGGGTQTMGAWIDTHATPVSEEVWDLYKTAVATLGPRPTIIEWDQDLPPLDTLLAQARRVRDIQVGGEVP